MNLTLATQQQFNSVMCDVWTNDNYEVFMTREQIGQALEYSEPIIAISKIHNRHKKRLDNFSVVTKLVSTDGKSYETTIYNEKGIYEVIRFSKQHKADEFFDFVYDLLSKLRKGENLIVKPATEYDKLLIQKQRAEAMLLNARTRQAKLILEMQKNKVLSPVAVELLQVNALETIIDKPVDHRPQIVEKHFSATEVGEMLGGIHKNKIGSLAKKYNLKTEEYGMWVLDKSPYSNKQVESFKYNQKGFEKIKDLLN